MAKLKIEAFGGMIPGTDSRLLPPNNAELTQNVWLYDGKIRPMRNPRLVYTLLSAATRMVYRIPKAGNLAINIPSAYWLEFAGVNTTIIKTPSKQSSDPAYYWAGNTPSPYSPKYTTQSRIVAGDHDMLLGVPQPLSSLSVSVSGGVSAITETRAYVHTYVTRYSEEGPPSNPFTRTGKVDDTWAVTVPAITTERGDTTKVITAITKAAQAQITAAAHGYALGDRVFTAAVVGMTQINNLYSTITQIVDANNFKVNIDSTGFANYTSGGTAQRIDREITKLRIYRTVTSDQGIATYYLVTEQNIQTTSYNDVLPSSVVATQGALLTTLHFPPPALDGFASMPNGMVIGWLGNQVWFCEPYKPWAWPVVYQQAVDTNVVGIGVVGQTAVICTEGTPYACTGTHPSNVQFSKVNSLPFPCVSRRSIVSTPDGVYYASPAGVILVGPGGGILATKGLVSQDDWQRLVNVARLNAAALNTAYYCFSGVGDGCFEPTAFYTLAFEQADFTGTRSGAIIDFSDQRVAFNQLVQTNPVYNVLTDPWSNEVMIITNGGVYQIDLTTNSAEGTYLWRSKATRMDYPTNFAVCRVFYDAPENLFVPYTGHIKIFGIAEGLGAGGGTMTLIYERDIPASGVMFKLPSGRRYDFYQIELSGSLRITSLQLATTAKELRGL